MSDSALIRPVTDYFRVDMEGVRYESVNFGAGKSHQGWALQDLIPLQSCHARCQMHRPPGDRQFTQVQTILKLTLKVCGTI
jgi:hypothetical protein